jgi:hypothetical protein
LGELPGATANWPELMLDQLGKLALLTHAIRRSDALPEDLKQDVRNLTGWSWQHKDIEAMGEHVIDTWAICSQIRKEQDNGYSLWTWLYGLESHRAVYHYQFVATLNPKVEVLVQGTQQRMELAIYPGAYRQRGQILNRLDEARSIDGPLIGYPTIMAFVDAAATILSTQPWMDRFLCVLNEVVPIYQPATQTWSVQDSAGHQLPIRGQDHWLALALSGGHPITLVGEWDTRTLRLFGVSDGTRYYSAGA